MGFKKSFFQNVAVFGGYSYISWFFDTLVSSVILSRFLGPEEYGFVALIAIFSGFIVLFSNTGLSLAIIRSEYGRLFQKIIFSLSIWIGLLLSLVLMLLAYPITLVYDNPQLFWPTIVISLQFFTSSFNIVPTAVLEKQLNFNYLGRINLISVVITIGLMIIMAVLGLSFWSLIIPPVVQPLLRQVFLEKKTRFGFHIYGWKLTRFGFSKVKTLFGSISLFNLVNYFARNADNFAIGKFYGPAALGLYDRAYKFLYMARRLINSTLGPVLFPSLVDARSKGEDIRSHFLDILGMLNVVNMLIAIPLVMLAKPITLVLWGKDWIGVADFMPYIGAIIPLQTLTIAAMDLYILDKKEKAYISLGIPMSLILVAGIAVGTFFSSLHIVRFYCLAFALVQTPVSLYFGHYRILKFTPKQIISFWVPKVILTNGLIFSIWFGTTLTTAIIMIFYIFDTVYSRFDDLKGIYLIVKQKLLEKLK